MPFSRSLIGSGKISALDVFDANPSIIYIGGGLGSGDQGPLQAAGVYRSTDGGVTWTQANNGLTDPIVDDLSINQNNSNDVVAATYSGGLFRTTDGGATWLNTGAQFSGITSLARSSATLYAAGTRGIALSNDGGATWGLAVATSRAARLVALSGTSIIGVLDNGTIFTAPASGGSPTTVYVPSGVALGWSIAVDPANTNTIAVILGPNNPSTNVVLSRDGGASWSVLAPPAAGVIGPQALAFSRTGSHALYAVANSAAFVTTNLGASWSSFPDFWDTRRVRVSPTSDSALLIATDQGVYQTTDLATWTSRSANLSNSILYGLAIAGSTILVSSQDWNPQISFDGGNSWQMQTVGGEAGSVTFDPTNPSICYTYSTVGFARSVDGCRTLTITQPVDLPLGGGSFIAADRTRPGTVYLARASGVVVSRDYGASFAKTGWPLSAPAGIGIDPSNGNNVFVLTASGLAVSHDAGATWRIIPTSSQPYSIAVAPNNTNVVLMGLSQWGSNVLSRSVDGGNTFSAVSGLPSAVPAGPAYYANGVNDITFDTATGSGIGAIATYAGIFVTNDLGVTWMPGPRAVGSNFFTGVRLSGGYLYATTFGNGVLRSQATVLQSHGYRTIR